VRGAVWRTRWLLGSHEQRAELTSVDLDPRGLRQHTWVWTELEWTGIKFKQSGQRGSVT